MTLVQAPLHARSVPFLLRRAKMPEHGGPTLCGDDGECVYMLADPGPEKLGRVICPSCREIIRRATT